ncbi:MAG TPA: pyridoxine 5'-phosphate synthase [Bacteroidia bacterium]|nr:pyridoxine 5'-phosphate synthase [Bacteroidia bacterium]
MVRLSVNINKIATLRNARGGNLPNVVQTAIDCQRFGADGITVHPRPDERHIRYQDVRDLKKVVKTEFNIEGYPSEAFNELVLEVIPDQVTLVPDPPDVLTSNSGWNTTMHQEFLQKTVSVFKNAGIRVSLFIDPVAEMIQHAASTGADRIELYTESYASLYAGNRELAVEPFKVAAEKAHYYGLGINAGHDLNMQNLAFFKQNLPFLDEVSIGHALISDALYFGLENTIRLYKRQLA